MCSIKGDDLTLTLTLTLIGFKERIEEEVRRQQELVEAHDHNPNPDFYSA